jgi:hypothetical protein
MKVREVMTVDVSPGPEAGRQVAQLWPAEPWAASGDRQRSASQDGTELDLIVRTRGSIWPSFPSRRADPLRLEPPPEAAQHMLGTRAVEVMTETVVLARRRDRGAG